MTKNTIDSNQIIIYQTRGEETKIEVRVSDETVWLTDDQMAEQFQRNKSTISRHIKNILESGEFKYDSVVAEISTTAYTIKKKIAKISALLKRRNISVEGVKGLEFSIC